MSSSPAAWSTCRVSPTRCRPPAGAADCRTRASWTSMIEGLYCGSRLQPGPEKGPVKDGPIVEHVPGKTLHHGTHGGTHRPDVQHQPGGDGRGGPAQPQQRRARHEGRRLQGRDRPGRDPPEEGQAPRHLRQGRALQARAHHGQARGAARRPSSPKSARSRPATPRASTTARAP